MERIQKLLSESGATSRREAEELIVAGRVTVNGRLVTRLPCFVDPSKDEVRIDGEVVRLRSARHTYILLNKPVGVVCSYRAIGDHTSVFDLVKFAPASRAKGGPAGRGLHCVAPLIAADAGLVLLTDDGQLAQQMRHPRFRLEKTYRVEMEGPAGPKVLAALRAGAHFGRWRTERATVKVAKRSTERAALEVTLAEAKSGELRRVVKQAGGVVRRVWRLSLGPLTDRGLKVGTWRRLKEAEVTALRQAIWKR